MAKVVKLKDRNSNSILPITRSTVVEMNEGISVEEKFRNIEKSQKLSFYTTGICSVNIYTKDDTLEGDYSEQTPIKTIEYSPNTLVSLNIGDTEHFEISNPNDCINIIYNWPGVCETFYDWFMGVNMFCNMVFNFNKMDHTPWEHSSIDGSQYKFGVVEAQYRNCIFWWDVACTNINTHCYMLHKTQECPLFYSTVPANTYKAVLEAYNITVNPNWTNDDFLNSFSQASGINAFAYTQIKSVPFAAAADAGVVTNIITLPANCQGLFYCSLAHDTAILDCTNVTTFGYNQSSWRIAFYNCYELRHLMLKNLKVSVDLSWSPISNYALDYIISEAANTGTIDIKLSPYTWYNLTDAIKTAATTKNINLVLGSVENNSNLKIWNDATEFVKKSELDAASYISSYSLDNVITYNSYNPATSYAVYNAIENKPNSIEIINELPDPTAYIPGTTCILYKTTEIENGDPVIFPIMVSGVSNHDINDEQNQYDINIAVLDTYNGISLRIYDNGIINEYNPAAQVTDNWLNYKTYNDDIQIYNGDDCRYSWETSVFNITVTNGENVNFYHFDKLTYINNGTSWVNLNDLTSHQDPDDNITVDDVENPPLYDVEYDKHIYCSVEPLTNDNFSMDSWQEWGSSESPILCIHNAERFLNTEEYVPVLMRKCKYKNGRGTHWGWKQYMPVTHMLKSEFRDDGVRIIPTTNMFDISNGKPFQGVFIFNEPIKYFPHVANNGTDMPTIAHGCNTIDLLIKNNNKEVVAATQYRAHWGISFIKKSDWPRNDRPLDFNKLVTNIAEFKILYVLGLFDPDNGKYNYAMRFLA